MKLFGEKSSREGIAEAVRKYGDINVREEDIGAVSTSICRSCFLLVKCIIEKTAKFYSVCHNADEKYFAPEKALTNSCLSLRFTGFETNASGK